MIQRIGVIFFGIIEVVIGAITFFAIILSLITGKSTKPLEVLIFVLAASIISFSLGLGILRRRLGAYHLILFFSTVIICSKILIFTKIISLSGALETTIPQDFKNIISIIYHLTLIIYFIQPGVREYFGERRNVLFSLRLPSFK